MRLYRDDACDLDAGMLVDEMRGARRERQELRHVGAMQHEQHELVGRCAGAWRTAAATTLPELESRLLLQQRFQIVRVVILAVDEDDLLRAAGDVVLALVLSARSPVRTQPSAPTAAALASGLSRVAAGDVLAA